MIRSRILLRPAALLIAVAVCFISEGAPPKAQASPSLWSVPGCPLLGTKTLAGQIFGSYQWSAGGGRDFPMGKTMAGFLPDGATMVACGFVRKWDSTENAAAPDSDILFSGFGQVDSSAALLNTWNNLVSRLGLQQTRRGALHLAEKPGFAAGYRNGQNTIAFAYWMSTPGGDFENVPGSRLRPLVTTIVCAGKKC